MRIIAGLAKGRRLAAPGGRGGESIRPTADRAREALFSILGWEQIRGTAVLDLFAGTGALGLEALSRGAGQAFFVDNNPLALTLIRQNIETCGFSAKAQVIRHDLSRGIVSLLPKGISTAAPFDIIFLDPPYRQGIASQILAALDHLRLLREGGMAVAEDASSETLPDTIGSLELFDRRSYGDTGFWLYESRLEENLRQSPP